MTSVKVIEVDVESLRTVRSLVNSTQVCLDGLESRMKKELEVISVAKTLSEKASRSLEEIIDPATETK